VVVRVLTIKPTKKRNRRRVKHVSVEKILHEAVDQRNHSKNDGSFPERRTQLLKPNLRDNEPNQREQPSERDDNGERKKRQ
jgi:hypothetical protein